MTGRSQTDSEPAALWVNGERRTCLEPQVSVFDRGLTLADGVFETMRAWGGTIFRLRPHLARLTHALAALAIPAPSDLEHQVLAAMRASKVEDAAVRIVVTRGPGTSGVAPVPEGDVRPTVIISIAAAPVFPVTIYDAGLSAHIASGRRNEHSMTAGLKTLAYVDSVAALLEARRAGADDAIFLDTAEHCCEATASNLFIWAAGTLVTPPLSCGVLPGITRAAVLDLARERGVPSEERAFGFEALARADEAFLTSSLRGLAPIARLGTHLVGGGAPGSLTRELTAAYTALVARECEPARGRP